MMKTLFQSAFAVFIFLFMMSASDQTPEEREHAAMCESHKFEELEEDQKVTFELVKEKVFKPLCLDCHSSAHPAGRIDLEKEDEAIWHTDPENPKESALYQSVASGFMPMGKRKLCDSEKELLLKWMRGIE